MSSRAKTLQRQILQPEGEKGHPQAINTEQSLNNFIFNLKES